MAVRDVKCYHEIEAIRIRLSVLEETVRELRIVADACIQQSSRYREHDEDAPDRRSRTDLVLQAIDRIAAKVDNLESTWGAGDGEDGNGSSVSSGRDIVQVSDVGPQGGDDKVQGQSSGDAPKGAVCGDGERAEDICNVDTDTSQVETVEDAKEHGTPRDQRARKLSELMTQPHPVWPTMSDTDRTIYVPSDRGQYSRLIPFKSARHFRGMMRTRFGSGFKYTYCKSFYDANSGYTLFDITKDDDTYSEGAYTELILTNGDRRVSYPLAKSRELVGWTGVAVDILKQVVASATGINDPGPVGD